MIQTLLTKVIGSKNERELKRLQVYVDKINVLEPEMEKLSDEALRSKTDQFREYYQKHMNIFKAGEGFTDEYIKSLNKLDLDEKIELEKIEKLILKEEKAILDDLLHEAFAVVREAAKRTLDMRHFDVQLMGGVVLHEGNIAEMTTGEGKTLVATLPVYLNALTGKGVHVVTVNDYLAKRDSEWMGRIYEFLGLRVGLIQHDMNDEERKKAYQSDITYGTNNEFGFDYLRDNMKFDLKDYVQREHNYAIVDEVDSILIDEARTPLIISGPTEERDADDYYKVYQIIPRLKEGRPLQGEEDKEEDGDYQVDEEKRAVFLTEQGRAKVEKYLGIKDLYESEQGAEGGKSAKYLPFIHKVDQALKAHRIFKRDVDYVVKDGEVVIVDEFTGRLMPGRRYSDGLHQALEAKEHLKIAEENQTLASITFQNYFRLYKKLAGMTGTADTEAVEFRKIYNLDVVVIPTNKPLNRISYSDVIYRTEEEKLKAIVAEIEDCHDKGQPVLVGTLYPNKSILISNRLKKKGIPHIVLNAENHWVEAQLIAQAGRKGKVTIATSMAGRGVDILLGGNPKLLAEADLEHNKVTEVWDSYVHLDFLKDVRYEDAIKEMKAQLYNKIQEAERIYNEKKKHKEDEQKDHLEYMFYYLGLCQTRYQKATQRIHSSSEASDLQEYIDIVEAYIKCLKRLDNLTGPFFEQERRKNFNNSFKNIKKTLEQAISGKEINTKEIDNLLTDFEKDIQDLDYRIQNMFKERGIPLKTEEDLKDIKKGKHKSKEAILFEEAIQKYDKIKKEIDKFRVEFSISSENAKKEFEKAQKIYVDKLSEVRERSEEVSEESISKYISLCKREQEHIKKVGGLHVVGSERFESRRIDNQLRGRSGRQGDPGSSRFYLSLEDDLLRIFGSEMISKILSGLGMDDGQPIEHKMITRTIERVQARVEGIHLEARKHILEYDDVMNKQREVIYEQRRMVLESESVKGVFYDMIEEVLDDLISELTSPRTYAEDWDLKGLKAALLKSFGFSYDLDPSNLKDIKQDGFKEDLHQAIIHQYESREENIGSAKMRHLEKMIMLSTIDTLWKDHLYAMDHLKEGIGMRGYGQKDPLIEYKREGFDMFREMIWMIKLQTVSHLFMLQSVREEEEKEIQRRMKVQQQLEAARKAGSIVAPQERKKEKKVGRNKPCPCGSGKKYKKCCGR